MLLRDYTKGIIDKGFSGEFASGIHLIASRDVVGASHGVKTPEWKRLMRPVRLLELIDEMLGDTNWHLHESQHADLQLCRKTFQNVFVNFTHIDVTDDKVVTEQDP